MTTIIIIISAIILTICFILFEIGWIYGEKNLRNELKYESLYKEIFDMYRLYDVNLANYDLIQSKLLELGQLKFKDKERTHILSCNFWQKYRSIACLKISKNDLK